MIQLAGLLFSGNRNGEISFEVKNGMKENTDTSEHSFEATLQKYQSAQNSYPKSAVQRKYDKRNNEKDCKAVDLEDNHRNAQGDKEIKALNISDEALKEFIQWLMVLSSGQMENSSITGDDFFESLKIIAPSIQNAIAQKSASSLRDMDELRHLFESLFLMDLEMDVGDEPGLLSNIRTILESLIPEGAKVNINPEFSPAGDIGNRIFSINAKSVSLEKEGILGDSFVSLMPKGMSENTKPDLKQIMSSMQLAELGKRFLISSTDGQENSKGLATSLEHEFRPPLSNIQDEIIAVKSFDESPLPDYDSQNGFLKTDEQDISLIQPMNINIPANEILDFTNILAENNTTGSVEIIRKLAEKITMNLNNNRYEIELQVKPEHLGRLILKVTLEDGVLAGRIFTTNQQTADILQSNLNNLKNALEEQGYLFAQLDVNVGNEGSPGQFQYPERKPIDTGSRVSAINPVDEMDELNGKGSNLTKSYLGLSEIDYFA